MSEETPQKKVVFCIPVYSTAGAPRPYPATRDSFRDSAPLLDAAGWDHAVVNELNCPYISAARATMLRKALDAKATDIVFIDSDVSWRPADMLKLLETEGDVVAGTYRFKKGEAEQGCKDEEYMGCIRSDPMGRPVVRESDGAIAAISIPAGFLKVTRNAVNRFMEAYPELCYGEYCAPAVDLFNHGAHKRIWFGEDYGFSRNWIDAGGEIWIVPNMNIDHSTIERTYKGNFHEFLMRRPGGSKSDNPVSPDDLRKQVLEKLKNKAA